jgi:hypothetical protein
MSTPTATPKSHRRWWVASLVVEVAALGAFLAYAWPVDVVIGLILFTAVAWRLNSLQTGLSEKEKDEQRKREEKESRELPSPFYEAQRLEKWFELKKLEYDKAADRYDNIYRAAWQNFSYLAVLSGGILAFGAKDLYWATAYCLALTPLAFWYIATFLPLDHYGDKTRNRLSLIEDEINQIYFPKPTDPKLRHFTSFRVSKYKWRVQDAVGYFGIVVCLFWVQMVVLAAHHAVDPSSARPEVLPRQALQLEPQPLHVEISNPEIATLRESLTFVSRKVQSIDSLLRCRMMAVGAQGRPPCKR